MKCIGMGRQILFDIPLPEQLGTASHLSPLKLIHKCYITYSSRAQQPFSFFLFFPPTESANTRDGFPKSFNYSNRLRSVMMFCLSNGNNAANRLSYYSDNENES